MIGRFLSAVAVTLSLVAAAAAQVGGPGLAAPLPLFVPVTPASGLSLIFTSASSQYLTQTGSAAVNTKMFTVAFWYKQTTNSSTDLYLAGTNSSNFVIVESLVNTGTTHDLVFEAAVGGSIVSAVSSNPVAADTNWHHFLAAVDTTQPTAANRVKIYIDGAQPSLNSPTYPSQYAALAINVAQPSYIGSYFGGGGNFFNGKLAQVYYVDGQALTPSSFITGTPGVPKAFSGSYGYVTGADFFLPFTDDTSTAQLGLDNFTEGNNWVLGNMSTSNQSSDNPGGVATNSLVFTSASSQHIDATGTTLYSNQKFTVSMWLKFATDNVQQNILVWGASANFIDFFIDATNHINVEANVSSSNVLLKTTSAAYTDTTNWHHFLFAFDLTQATAANRVRFYYDGTEVTSWGTNTIPAQNSTVPYNTATDFGIGWNVLTSSHYLNAKMSQLYFINGQQLTPSSFISGTPGVPIAFTGSYGTPQVGVNWFLPFSNASSTTTLGLDASGQSHNWTLTNMTTANSSSDYP